MKRKELLEIIKEVGVNSPDLQNTIEKEVTSHLKGRNVDDLRNKVEVFISKFRLKYNKHQRIWPRMLEKEYEWLEGELIKEDAVRDNINVEAGPGRPIKPWDEASDRLKRRKVQLL